MGVKLKVDGNKLKTYMVEQGFTLKEFSDATKVCTPTLRKALNGECLTPKSINKILEHLDEFNVEDLVVLEDG